jgi:hypothetical protein
MDPYAKAAFGFAKAYQMNMQAADEQRKANQPSSNAFAEGVADEETDYRYSPQPQGAAPPNEQYNGMESDDGNVLDQSNGNALMRARQKVSKYLRERD